MVIVLLVLIVIMIPVAVLIICGVVERVGVSVLSVMSQSLSKRGPS